MYAVTCVNIYMQMEDVAWIVFRNMAEVEVKKECSKCNGTGKIRHSKCSGKIAHNICLGNVYIKTPNNCLAHNIWETHHYCISSSHHGNNVNEYHK